MFTKAERITELLGIVNNKAERIKKLKVECGQQAIKICVLDERIAELEKTLNGIRLTSGRSYKLPVTSVAAMKNMKIINRRCEQALKGK